MVTKFGHITILVDDYDKALAFYTEKLGFIKLSDNVFGPDLRWVDVAPAKSSETAIVFVKADTPQKQRTVGKQAPEHVLITLLTNDIEKDFKTMRAKGVVFHGEPAAVAWGKEVMFEDLYGNLFDLLERKSPG